MLFVPEQYVTPPPLIDPATGAGLLFKEICDDGEIKVVPVHEVVEYDILYQVGTEGCEGV